MLSIRGLTHTYPGGRKQPERTALRDLSLTVEEGQFCILSGPNGSGKSTLFRILCGLTTPSHGQVSVHGFDLSTQARQVRQVMGVVFQSPAVDKQLSVEENLRLHGAFHGLRPADYAARREEALEWSDLKDRLGDRVETLSGGLARQVELAKCLLTRPRVLLLDEPTTGLDPASRRSFLSALGTVQRHRGMTVLMTSHIFSEAEAVDSVAIMAEGRLLAHGSPASLKAAVGSEMLVVVPRQADSLAAALRQAFSRDVLCHNEELRIEDLPSGEAAPLVQHILQHHRDDILSVSVKQPDLEDVFVHVTGKSAQGGGGTGSLAKESRAEGLAA